MTSCLDEAKKYNTIKDLQTAEWPFTGVSIYMLRKLFAGVEVLATLSTLIHLVICTS